MSVFLVRVRKSDDTPRVARLVSPRCKRCNAIGAHGASHCWSCGRRL